MLSLKRHQKTISMNAAAGTCELSWSAENNPRI